MINGLMTVTTVEETPEIGFTATLKDGNIQYRCSAHCIIPVAGETLNFFRLPDQEETFANPPEITDFTLGAYEIVKTTHDEQPSETFSSPPEITDFTITILDVNGDPL
jgi:hypothetical protein